MHRGPGLGRVVGAEVRRQPAVERVVALAADVHHRGRQLRGVADEPRRGDVAVLALVAVPVLPAAGRPSASALRAGAGLDDLLQGVADVAAMSGSEIAPGGLLRGAVERLRRLASTTFDTT